MKPIHKTILAFALILMILPSCSLLSDINQSIDYADQAAAYVQDVNLFAEEIRTLAEQSAAVAETRTAIEEELVQMKEKIITFNAAAAPAFAVEIHNQLVSYNETLLSEINAYMEQLGEQVDFQALKDSPIIQSANQIAQILQQLEQLGN